MSIGRSRKRDPKGVSTGGRFAREEHVEAPISLGRVAPPVAPEALQLEASSPNLSLSDWERFSSHDQPSGVRLAAANSLRPGAADRAAEDPDPIVRMSAVGGWDLSPANERRLSQDPMVQRIAEFIAA